eukprot:TRINITY_DN4437_c0_g1_i2.p1 TRINITY_DN4437_c0_g1~~TRINITY_DN4437_c0_g1_i2.p1  ORF type:complete len:506 (-),score=98.04 TRINITY_DN4437_c0_g1_i2:229-1746(-)
MYKRSTGMAMKEWKRRWFVVRGGKMYYYRNWKDQQPQGVINLLLASVKRSMDSDKFYSIEIISQEKSYMLQAENEHEMQEWLAVIQNAIGDQLNHMTLDSSRSATTPLSAYDPSAPSSAYSSAHPTPHSPSHDESPLALLYAASEYNQWCADCGNPNPDWVSINLGVLLCIECSGIHRSLGVHITKVRSLTLDKLDPDLLNFLLAAGNERGNFIWEHTLRDDSLKPPEGSDRAARERHIRNKYIEKKYLEHTPLHSSLAVELFEACAGNDLYRAMLCLAHGADINAPHPDEEGKRPLHACIYTDALLCAELLAQNDADVNATDNYGWTPLHFAAFKNRVEGARLLVRRGARLDMKEEKGHTPVNVAVAYEHWDCLHAMESSGRKGAGSSYTPAPAAAAAAPPASGVASTSSSAHDDHFAMSSGTGNAMHPVALALRHAGASLAISDPASESSGSKRQSVSLGMDSVKRALSKLAPTQAVAISPMPSPLSGPRKGPSFPGRDDERR